MIEVRRSDRFRRWLDGLADGRAREALYKAMLDDKNPDLATLQEVADTLSSKIADDAPSEQLPPAAAE